MMQPSLFKANKRALLFSFIGMQGAFLLLEGIRPCAAQSAPPSPLEVAGVAITPHVRAKTMRFWNDPGKADGALVRLFVRNRGTRTLQTSEVLFNNYYPLRHITTGAWSWHDTPNLWEERDTLLPPGALMVWTFNANGARWGAGAKFDLTVEDWSSGRRETQPIHIPKPTVWLSAVTFLGEGASVQPNRILFHIANASKSAVTLVGARLYLPKDRQHYRLFIPQNPLENLTKFPQSGVIPAGERGGAEVFTPALPLGYIVLEALLKDAQGKALSLWARLRVKREVFDIGGGWIADAAKDGVTTLAHEPYLKTLSRMHVNLGHHNFVPKYTDGRGANDLFTRYPMKLFGDLLPTEDFDKEEWLPHIHGVDALGEPQLGFSKDQHTPQQVWKALEKYAPTRLPTTITLNDESTWRFYAGLSDYPHHDNYRVTAPSVDVFAKYERWGEPLGWGAPLETIGDLCRSLREMSRPAPTAYWSQGAHAGWDAYAGRLRTSPTPDEMRLQAYHALSTRITSLYWFNLSLRSLARFRDLLDELTRIGREIRMLEDLYLEGDAHQYRQSKRDGTPDWDLASIASPRGAVLFALDLDYMPDRDKKVFTFKQPRSAHFAFDLPIYLRHPQDVFRVDADGVYDVKYRTTKRGVEIEDTTNRVALYIATPIKGLRAQIEARRQSLIASERNLNFDPANNDADFNTLKEIVAPR